MGGLFSYFFGPQEPPVIDDISSDTIHIEYCYSWGYKNYFLRARAEISEELGLEVIGNMKPPRSGAFEVTDGDGNIYFSKFETNRMPQPGEVSWFIDNLFFFDIW